ncbi:MAG: HAD-IIA family hydrolase [Stappiaceae bacterium]
MPLSDNMPAFFEGFDTQSAFDFYESVRHRLPEATFPRSPTVATGLMDIAEHCDVFVLDAFGVLNVGNTAIAGAVERITQLRAMGKQVYVITNAATMTKQRTIEKFERLGFDFTFDEIVTSRMAAENAIAPYDVKLWGVMSKTDFQSEDLAVPSILLANDIDAYDKADAFLLLSTGDWSSAQQKLLEASLSARARPIVVANPDVIAPRETCFSTETGFTAHRIANRLRLDIEFHGKPFRSVFDLVEASLKPGFDRSRICMVGDTLHTDVLGGAAQGWSTALVTDFGLFQGHDVTPFINISGIVPNWIVPAI